MDQTGTQARLAALNLLDQIIGEGRLMSELTGQLDALPTNDRARAQRLAMETLRQMPNADRILAPFLKKRPKGKIRTLLQLATVEICSGGAGHGVVNSAVNIAKSDRNLAGLKGLVNAVLRRVSDEGPARWADLGEPRLPSWLREPLHQAWGAAAVRRMERAHAEGGTLDLTVKSDPEGWARKLGGAVLPTGTVRLSSGVQVTALDGYDDGEWWVQDAAAALPARILDPKEGERILDLCAAPGGKTLQLAVAGAKVTAVDNSKARMKRVEENLARTKLAATCSVVDALRMQGRFDAVLLDAPCSATGTIRRHPDLPHAKDGTGFSELMEMQTKLLAHAATLVRPGGRLVFCTCSVIPDEGEVQIETFLAANPGWTMLPIDLPGIEKNWRASDGGLRILPRPEGTDGFYIAALARPT